MGNCNIHKLLSSTITISKDVIFGKRMSIEHWNAYVVNLSMSTAGAWTVQAIPEGSNDRSKKAKRDC